MSASHGRRDVPVATACVTVPIAAAVGNVRMHGTLSRVMASLCYLYEYRGLCEYSRRINTRHGAVEELICSPTCSLNILAYSDDSYPPINWLQWLPLPSD